MSPLSIFPSYRRMLVFAVDLVLIVVAYLLAFLLRFDLSIPPEELPMVKLGLVVVLVVKPLVFISFGTYQHIWRYASLQDALEIVKTVTISSVLSTFFILYLTHFNVYHRSIFILDVTLLFLFVASSRLCWRVYREHFLSHRHGGGKRTLIVGAGDAGNLLLKEIRKQGGSGGYRVVGFLDDDTGKIGLRLSGVSVLGNTRQLTACIRRHAVQEVIIAIPSAPKKFVRELMACCKESDVSFKILPGIGDIIDGTVSVSQLKPVDIEDLLGRDQVNLDQVAIQNFLSGKRVLVTGAAGSIGSELCRQICSYAPSKLVLLDCAETPLYHIEKELIARNPDLRIVPIMADVRQRERIAAIFDSFLPQVVFHAAAYKHVPMMEYNPMEAISNNVGGTGNLADISADCGVENFVMISTDKAVNPTNVMGASKRAAELYIQALAQKSRTRFATVRFGNVLGSNGSVIPLFKEQIARGGPVTVTDPRVIRYFMTIPEACQLVLQAGTMGKGSDIFVLDMGEPVRILDLAEELIRLSGLTPHEDIEIVFSGLRPGEKLFEELLIEGEGVLPTSHEKIHVAAAVRHDPDLIRDHVTLLLQSVLASDVTALVKQLKAMVPEYTPRYHFDGEPPFLFRRLRPDVCLQTGPISANQVND